MQFSFDWIKEYLAYEIDARQAAEILGMHSFEVEGVERAEDDHVLGIDVLPNRAHDCYSHQGIARELNAAIAANREIYSYKEVRPKRALFTSESLESPSDSDTEAVEIQLNSGNIDNISVTIENPDACPRFSCQLIENITVGESPEWMKRRLIALGLEPISNIVDISNYVMLDVGNPMHAFDADQVRGGNGKIEMLIRYAREGEVIKGLDGNEYELESDNLVVGNIEHGLAIGGIKGGEGSGISDKTTTILLEAANFEPTGIYKTSKALKLVTDASRRFGAGVPQELPFLALARAAELIREVCPDSKIQPVVQAWPGKDSARQKSVAIDYATPSKLLGVNVSEDRMRRIFESLGFCVDGNQVVVPFWRLDVQIEQDLVEEIGRMYGYEAIPEALPIEPVQAGDRNDEFVFRNRLRSFMVGSGFDEVYNYVLVDHEAATQYAPDEATMAQLALKNTLSDRHAYLRSSLVPGLLDNIQHNKKYFDIFQIFEIGKIYPDEAWQLGIAMCVESAFFVLKGRLESLFCTLGITDVRYIQDGIATRIRVNGSSCGFIGMADAQNDKNKQCAIAQIDVVVLRQAAVRVKMFTEPAKYPAIARDVSIELDKHVTSQAIIDTITRAGGVLFESIELIDIYEGDKIPAGKKALTYRVTYRDAAKTLTDEDANTAHAAVETALKKEHNGIIR